MILVYVAGPYRAPTTWGIQKNIHNARMWGVVVAKAGAYPMIPHSNTSNLDGAVEGDEFWLQGTMEMMRRCDGVFLTDDWIRSSGSRAEKAEAERLGIPVLDGDGWAARGASQVHDDVAAWIQTLRPNFREPLEKNVEAMALLDGNIQTIRSGLDEIEHHTHDLDGQVFTVQSSRGATNRAALILKESNRIREALGKIWDNLAWYNKPEHTDPS